MYCAYIARIKDLRKHSNADRLQVGTLFGNSVIVGLDVVPDQLGVYFPTDGKLGVECAELNDLIRRKDADGNQCGGYLDPAKRNIKTLRLRGEESDGLFMPLSSLNEFCDITALKEGDTITTLNGILICEKYIPRTNPPRQQHSNNGKKKPEPKERYPFFAEHSDTEQLAYNLNRFRAGDRIILTLKVHGTSQRTAYALQETHKPRNILQRIFRRPSKAIRAWDYISGTRRTVLTTKAIADGGYYGDNAFRMKWHDYFRGGRLRKGEEVFYEVVGYVNPSTTIMAVCNNKKVGDKEFVKQYGATTTFSYGCPAGENDIYVYRMTMTNEDGDVVEYPWDLVKLRCEQMGVKVVPEFERFDFTDDVDLMARVNAVVGGADPIGRVHIREGVVVRIENKEHFSAYKHKNFEFKVLEGIIKESAAEPDMEESEEIQEMV